MTHPVPPPRRPMRQVRVRAPALPAHEALALLDFLETAMRLLGNWPFTILATTEYTDPETGELMVEAVLEVPPYPEPSAGGSLS